MIVSDFYDARAVIVQLGVICWAISTAASHPDHTLTKDRLSRAHVPKKIKNVKNWNFLLTDEATSLTDIHLIIFITCTFHQGSKNQLRKRFFVVFFQDP